jgi:hypothetical protein
VLLRAADADYDDRGPGWTAEELRPYLERAETTFGTRPLNLNELSPFIKSFADAAGADAMVHQVNMTPEGVRCIPPGRAASAGSSMSAVVSTGTTASSSQTRRSCRPSRG